MKTRQVDTPSEIFLRIKPELDRLYPDVSEAELSRRATGGKSKDLIRHMRKGIVRVPSGVGLNGLARLLNRPVNWVLTGLDIPVDDLQGKYPEGLPITDFARILDTLRLLDPEYAQAVEVDALRRIAIKSRDYIIANSSDDQDR